MKMQPESAEEATVQCDSHVIRVIVTALVTGAITVGSLNLVGLLTFNNSPTGVSSHKTCRTTYTDDNMITESMMQVWAADVSWPLTHPRWSDQYNACVCSDDPRPVYVSKYSTTPAWIAPLDLASLYGIDKFPPAFKPFANASRPEDHVKVCLEKEKLDTLWQLPTLSGAKHCHADHPFNIFTGWDGDLFCSCA